MNKEDTIVYPVILNKYLALKQICSRKEADRLLKSKKITVNGKLGEPGQMIYETDKVTVQIDKKLIYLAYHKPRGIITHSPQGSERGIADIFKYPEQVFPVGRLDKASSGLIILTNDGRVTDRLLNPDFWHEKEYEVLVNKSLTPDVIRQLAAGVTLDDGYLTRRCKVYKISEKIFGIILTEGKKHQIRRMCQSVGLKVVDLKRVRIMNIELGNVKPGGYRKMVGKELEDFCKLIDLIK